MSENNVILPPVITIDGLGGTGKSSLASLVAKYLSWNKLDSGAYYRILAYISYEKNIEDEISIVNYMKNSSLKVQYGKEAVYLLNNLDISKKIREPHISNIASKIGQYGTIRDYVRTLFNKARLSPGLVADGRDMGTIVFKDAICKIFLQSNNLEKAKRRQLQLKEDGLNVSLEELTDKLQERDSLDASRSLDPTRPHLDALIVDTSNLNLQEVFELVKKHIDSLFVK